MRDPDGEQSMGATQREAAELGYTIVGTEQAGRLIYGPPVIRKIVATLPITDELLADSQGMNVRRLLFPTRLERILARFSWTWALAIGVRFDHYSRWLSLALPFVEIRVARLGVTRCANGVKGHDPYYDECLRSDDDDEDLD
jgi:hypothetical protein